MSIVRDPRVTARPAARRQEQRVPKVVVWGLAGAVVLGVLIYIVASFWTAEAIEDTYGKRQGLVGGASVNGTAVLADLFRQRGCQVSSWKRLSPRLMRADTIVWVPDSFEPPTALQRRWFEDWLEAGYDRTLVYVGRDYDAEVIYWEDYQAHATAAKAKEVARRLASAKADHDNDRMGLANEVNAEWFNVRRHEPHRRIRHLAGDWSQGVDASKSKITLDSRFDPPPKTLDDFDVETLLEAPSDNGSQQAPDALAIRLSLTSGSDGQIIVIPNGSFVLNLPLVNHEHRKLAAKLIDECRDPEDVIFLESGRSGLAIVDKEPARRQPGALDMMSVWPLCGILTHVVAVGALLCFALFPIFGHPRSLHSGLRSDFSKHIESLGRLLEKTRDEAYAREQVQHYQTRVKRESGVNHSRGLVLSRPVSQSVLERTAGPQANQFSTVQQPQEEDRSRHREMINPHNFSSHC